MISPRNFDCTEVMDHLDDYRRNEIEPHLRVMISEHLAGCDACAAELRTREALAEAMKAALSGSPAPVHLPSKVRRAIVAQPLSQTGGRRNGQLLPWMLAAAVLVTIGIAMLQVDTAKPLQGSQEIAAVPLEATSTRQSAQQFSVQQQKQSAAGNSALAIKSPGPVQSPAATEPTELRQPAMEELHAPNQVLYRSTEKTAPSPAGSAPNAPSAAFSAEAPQSPVTSDRRLFTEEAEPESSDQKSSANRLPAAELATTATVQQRTTAPVTTRLATDSTTTSPL